ncbi:MAG: FHA domain-containing protein [Verrucomicrobia bacterium]|jgi:hypothetical protein|nr:FHA domain-containing protein [Verrucomicrobiota bacterium]
MNIQLIQDGDVVADIDLKQGEYTIGSAEGCSIIIEDDSISAQHARLYERDTTPYIADLDSNSGTTVNGIRVTSATQLSSGDQLTVGAFQCSVAVPDAVPDEEVANECPQDDVDEAVTTEDDPSVDAHVSASDRAKGIGKGLLGLARASAREAGRGARLAALKAQIEKQKRIDLHGALASLGAKAFELRIRPEICQSLYDEIDEIDKSIAEKRLGEAAGDDASFAQRAKVKAIGAKRKAEAEALFHKRKGKCANVGRLLLQNAATASELVDERAAVTDIVVHIKELYKQLTALAEGHGNRDTLAASARNSFGHAGAVSFRSIWRKPAVRAALVVSLIVIAFVGKGVLAKRSKSGGRTGIPKEHWQTFSEGAEAGRRFAHNTVDGRPANWEDFLSVMKRLGTDFTPKTPEEDMWLFNYQVGFNFGMSQARKAGGTQLSRRAVSSSSSRDLLSHPSRSFSPSEAAGRGESGYQKLRDQAIGTRPQRNQSSAIRRQEAEALRAEIRSLEQEVASLSKEMIAESRGMMGGQEGAGSATSRFKAKQSLLHSKLVQLRRLGTY